VREIGGDQALELCHELVGALRRQVEFEQLDRDEVLALRIVGAKHRPQGSRADLVKHSKRSEGVGRRIANSVSVQ